MTSQAYEDAFAAAPQVQLTVARPARASWSSSSAA